MIINGPQYTEGNLPSFSEIIKQFGVDLVVVIDQDGLFYQLKQESQVPMVTLQKCGGVTPRKTDSEPRFSEYFMGLRGMKVKSALKSIRF